MKKIKRLSLVVFFILVANIKVFAGSGFEGILNVAVGSSFPILSGGNTGFQDFETKIGFDASVQLQLGYMIDFNILGLSILGDFGYHFDSYAYSHKNNNINKDPNDLYVPSRINCNVYLHGFQVGVLPKLHFGNFSLGIGGGVKVPLKIVVSTTESSSEEPFGDVIGYVKLTGDYSLFVTETFAFNFGVYLRYDIGPSLQYLNNNRIDSFDIGGQIGLKFGSKQGS